MGFKLTVRFFLFLLLLQGIAYGQDLKKDLMSLYGQYAVAPSFKIVMKIQVYNSTSPAAPFLKQEASISKKENSFHHVMEGTEMLMTEHSLIMLNKPQRVMLYRKISKKEYNSFEKNMLTSSLDSTILNYDSVSYRKEKGNMKKYSIYTTKKVINKTDLFFNGETNEIEKIIYYYDNKRYKDISKVEIDFNQTSGSENPEVFSETYFISGTGKGLKPSSRFSNYHLSIVQNED